MKTFNTGGIHPKEHKLTAAIPITPIPVPAQVSIPLSQNLGAPSNPLVAKGDKVVVGQLIATGEAFISSNLHSPVSGTVAKIDNVTDTSGYRRPAIIIDVEGDEWEAGVDRSEHTDTEIRFTREQIIERIKESGIVGMGGATFPTHVKLMVPKDKKAEMLIINGVECEPYLTSDHRLMLEKGPEVITGIRILMIALGVDKACIGIENNKKDAIVLLQKLAAPYANIEVVPLKVKFPQGGEKQLIKAITGREVPSGKLPIETGCVVNNVATAYAVYEAVQKNKPLIERVITVTGKSLSRPGNFRVRVGTPVSWLIEHAGGLPTDTGKVINGGPMMGKSLTTLDAPATKGTSGILVMPETESHRAVSFSCIRCGPCISVCPMGLQPVYIAQTTSREMLEEAEKANVMDCIECGSCQFICPSGKPLLDMVRLGKNKVGTIIRNRVKN